MSRKKKQQMDAQNYLERIPIRSSLLEWSADENGMVTLHIENRGVFNRIAQKVFFRPKVSHVHLDKLGSFIWPLLDEKKNIVQLGELVEAEFGEEAQPLYERLAKFFQVLESYHFVEWNRSVN